VDALDQIAAVLAAGADVILLDNFTPAQLKKAVALIAGRAFTEASGGITLKSLPRLAPLGLDFVSTGALVHQSIWVDIGLDWRSRA
jgi:nicotinate-nucleotide pyrophosphorylase (carboxylating)